MARLKNFFNLLFSKQKTVSATVFVVTGILIVTKLLGFLKVRIIAHNFGTSVEYDTFLAANRIPDALFQSLVAGTLTSAMLPLLSKRKHKSDSRFFESLNGLLFLFSVLFGIVSLLTVILAPWIAQLYINATSVKEAYDLALLTNMIRYLSFIPLILSISNILTAALQVYDMFFISSLSLPIHTLALMFGAATLSKFFDPPIWGLVWGSLLGSVLHLLIQLPGIIKLGYKLRVNSKRLLDDIKYMFVQSLPRVMGLALENVVITHATALCLEISTGALSAYQYAFQLFLLPSTIIGHSLAQAMFQPFARLVHEKNFSELRTKFLMGLDAIFFTTIPIAVIIIILRVGIIRIFLSTGEFDWWSVIVTSWIFALLAIAIVFQSTLMLILRIFYALEDTFTPFLVTIGTTIINIVLNILFTNFFSHFYGWRSLWAIIDISSISGIFETLSNLWTWFFTRDIALSSLGGLGLALTVSLGFECSVLYFISKKRLKFTTGGILPGLTKKIVAAGFMAGAVFFILDYLQNRSGALEVTRTLDTIVIMAIAAVFGGFVYLVILWIENDIVLDKMMEKMNEYRKKFIKVFSFRE
ncbi:polysaccharide biosynthesis C-terminal domain-containing protein [Candidatus Dojkabacteria bacterium]|nr:polysaccharide biosynthesis C-terminal domain-containing protein [Candidatus Dojkabacteria bacterium]